MWTLQDNLSDRVIDGNLTCLAVRLCGHAGGVRAHIITIPIIYCVP